MKSDKLILKFCIYLLIILASSFLGIFYINKNFVHSQESPENQETFPHPSELPYIYKNYTETQDIIDLIHQKSHEVGLSGVLLQNIAFCESTLDPTAKNPNSSASGLFQITKATQLDAEKVLGKKQVFDAEDNIDMAIYFMLKGQWSRWNESKGCWGNV